MHLVYGIIRSFNIKYKLRILRRLSSIGNILDTGCGTGEFLKSCQDAGWNVTGIEPFPVANLAASKLLNIPVNTELTQLTTEDYYNVITYWHVIEHIYDLHTSIETAKKLLSKNGKIVIALPNIDSQDSKIFQEFWAAYDVPRHLYHFNQVSFSKLMKDHNLKIVETIPMYFDAYYISLLSDKYRTGKYHWIKSIITGYKSNSYANKNQNNFSSLVYVLKK
jgi:2-polyprenyl-3-methyl-5-hydroxy-6-metoxy-1,4-benzoquinol methylase